MSMNVNVYALGASRNIGYYAAIRLLEKGATITFLLRSPSTFDNDATIQKYVQEGKAILVKGDAMVKDDVAKGWEIAQQGVAERGVDYVLFSVGTYPKFSITKGLYLDPPNICTNSILNVLQTMPPSLRSPTPNPTPAPSTSSPTTPTSPSFRPPLQQPKFIVISSTGITKSSHAKLPLLLKPLYSSLLAAPHVDKLGLERVLSWCAGWEWDDKKEGVVKPEVLPRGWEGEFWVPKNDKVNAEGTSRAPPASTSAPSSSGTGTEREGEVLLQSGWLKELVLLRPVLYTDGACKADEAKQSKKEPYRVADKEIGGGYTISRKDVAHFIVEGLMPPAKWEEWKGKSAYLAY